MQKTELVDEINAFAAARASGNPLLLTRQAAKLEELMSRLPDEVEERTIPAPEQDPTR